MPLRNESSNGKSSENNNEIIYYNTQIITKKNGGIQDEEDISSEEEQQYAPNLEFVEVNVDNIDPNEDLGSNNNTNDRPDEGDDEEFAFPLFAGASTSQDEVMKVSLKEHEDEVIINERPEDYYRAFNSEEKRAEFEFAAVTFEDILREANASAIDAYPWKVVDLLKYNEKIEHDQKQKKHKREGKRKRQNKSICRERRKEREREIKRLEREEKKQRFKVKGQGWKVNKSRGKLEKSASRVEKPKYRTE
ncbi:hypothetical protein JCM33374_g1828 [Metschnikowia sp. JCM 33374]|nr:hypothetical protein JCM33374_g1828 [Metschnikowia sp. JCM 33374]